MPYSHMANATLPLAQRGFTSEFGKGSGGSHVLWSPAQLLWALYYCGLIRKVTFKVPNAVWLTAWKLVWFIVYSH